MRGLRVSAESRSAHRSYSAKDWRSSAAITWASSGPASRISLASCFSLITKTNPECRAPSFTGVEFEESSLSHACNAKRSCDAGQAIECTKMFSRWQAIIEVALHFPAAEIELAACATAQTASICLTLTGKRTTHLSVPTTKQAS